LCKTCGRQFIGDHALQYKGSHSGLTEKILMMLVRGTGIRDIAANEKNSIKKVLSALVHSRHLIQPKQLYYDCLEVNELWTYVGRKSRKVWLI
jgi:transposase-like protein